MNTNTSAVLETILLVDDDASIRITVKTILEMQDYKVIEADSGEECLNICQQQTANTRPNIIRCRDARNGWF